MLEYYHLLRRNPQYAKLWIAQVISLTGDWFNTVALLGLVALYSDGSGVAIGLFLVFRTLPPLIAAPFAGVLLDRFNRRNLLVWSNLLRAAVVPFFLLADGPDMLWLIYLVTIIQFTLSSIFEPGQAAIIPALVQSDDIVESNTLMSVTWSVMLALGAILGGVFAYVFGIRAALIMDAITFVVAGGLIMWVDYDPQRGRKLAKAIGIEPSADDEDTSFIEGLRYLRKSPQVAAGIFVKFGQSLGNIDTLMTIYATQIFVIGTNGELSLAILWSLFGVGAIAGPILTNLFNDNTVKRLRRLIIVGFAFIMLGWGILGVATSLAVVSLAIFSRSMGGSINWTYSNVVIQKSAPDSKLGRMFSIDMIGFYAGTVVSQLIHGWLVDTVGVENIGWIVWGTAVVALVPSLIWVWIVPALERMESDMLDAPAPASGD
jgi:MFS family permease